MYSKISILISKLSIIGLLIKILISIVSITIGILSILSNANTWFSTPKQVRNPGHANHVFKKTHCSDTL